MKHPLKFVKMTVLGGFVFLVPAIIIVVALGKLIGVLRTLAKALSPFFGIESLVGGLVLDLFAIGVTVLLCLVAGLLAQRSAARRIREKLDATLLNSFPGYAFIKTFSENLRQTEELAGSFLPILVQFDDYAQIAFETQREPSGGVVAYLPGAPNPWSGTMVYVASDRVRRLPMTLTEALRTIRGLGRTSVDIAGQDQKVGSPQDGS